MRFVSPSLTTRPRPSSRSAEIPVLLMEKLAHGEHNDVSLNSLYMFHSTPERHTRLVGFILTA